MPRRLFERHEEFAEAVKKSGGKIVVLVHPYYADHDDSNLAHERPWLSGFAPKSPEVQKAEKIAKAEYDAKLRKLAAKAKVPIVVLEEHHQIHESGGRFRNRGAFFVPTFPGNPQPIDDWPELHAVLRRAKVENILVAGTYSHGFGGIFNGKPVYVEQKAKEAPEIVAHESKMPRPPVRSIVYGCVGSAYEELIKAGFKKVRIVPNLVFPDKPIYAKQQPHK